MKRVVTIAIVIYSMLGMTQTATAQNSYNQHTNLPTIYINTFDNKKITSKEEYIYATLHFVDSTGITVYDSMQIRGRGNSTWTLPKKPYRLKFKEKEKFLGNNHANAKSWTLLANHADKTLIRNAMASCIGAFAGQPFTAAAEFVDLYINDDYKGCYQISDQIEVRKKRVNITEQDEIADENSNITGGYLLEIDGFAKSEPVYITTSKGLTITIKSPDEDIINERQIKYIKDFINEFERTLFSNDFADPNNGYRQYVDSLTLASWYIATELTGNVDGFWSTYIYKEKDDTHIYWGPLWDYDIAFNNDDRVGDVNEKLMRDKAHSDVLTKVWIKQMWKDPWFIRLINRTWKELLAKGYEQHVLDYLDNLAQYIDYSQKANFEIWPIDKQVYNEYILFSTYEEGVAYLRNYIVKRFDYLTRVFEESEQNVAEMIPTQEFIADSAYLYRLKNKGNNFYADITSSNVHTQMSAVNETQQWDIIESSDGYYYIQNYNTGQVLADGAKASSSGKYNTGSMLVLEDKTENRSCQEWKFVPIAYGDVYVIENRLTGLTMRNESGTDELQNYIVTDTNNGTATTDNNSLWYITQYSEKPVDGIDNAADTKCEYIITYNTDTKSIRFIAENGLMVTGIGRICSLNGKEMMHFNIDNSPIDIAHLASDTYILIWNDGNRTRNIKFVKQ